MSRIVDPAAARAAVTQLSRADRALGAARAELASGAASTATGEQLQVASRDLYMGAGSYGRALGIQPSRTGTLADLIESAGRVSDAGDAIAGSGSASGSLRKHALSAVDSGVRDARRAVADLG